MLYDAHNHLQDAWLAPHLPRILTDLDDARLGGVVINGTSEADWAVVTAVSARLSAHSPRIRVVSSYGLHPWNVGNASSHWREDLQRTLGTDHRAGVGEIGLDRWMLERARPDDARLAGLRRASLDEQLEAFTWQLALAAEQDRPVTIHCLDAWGALERALRTSPGPSRGFLLHAYGGSADLARELCALGAYFSFNGYFLGERQAAKRAVFKELPLDRVLMETDAPAMPLPRGQRTHELPGAADGNPVNHPANIGAVYRGFAELRGIELITLVPQIEENFRRLFNG